MKKLSAFIMVLLVLCGFMFADVTVKNLGDGTAEVTFFYGNPKATEVVVAGSWTDWEKAPHPMTKVEKGWEYKTIVPIADTVLKYKFISDGNWTPDIKAPDTIDDGFGGKNGLVEVAVLAAAEAPAASGAAAAPATGKLKFQTWSMLGFQTKFNIKDGFETESAGINLKSYLKVGGDMLPNMPVYIEVALAEQDGFENLYKKDSLSWGDGFQNLLVDTIFDPIYFYGGQEASKSYLGHLKLGLTTPYVEFATGYKYAKLPAHKNVSWTTLDQDWEAGYNSVGGFSAFTLGQALRQIGDVKINAQILPNRTADRAGSQYGMAAWASAEYAGHYVDLQYNGAYGKTYKTIFDEVMEMDIIAGYSGKFGPIGVKLNALMNKYGDVKNADGTRAGYTPPSSDVGTVYSDADFIDNFAANVQTSYGSDLITATLGYRMRGVQASMMYVEDGKADDHEHIKDQLGDRNSQRVWLNLSSKPMSYLSVGLDTSVDMVLDKNKTIAFADKDNLKLSVKPSAGLKLQELAGIDASVDVYGQMYYNTKDKFADGTADGNQFKLKEIGVKFALGALNDAVKGIDVMYGLDNDNDTALFNTLLAAVKLPMNVTAQAGFGIRTAKGDAANPDTPFGFFLGASTPLKVLQKPVLYAQFLYGMDPYKGFGDGQENFNLDGYTLDSGVGNWQNNAAVRVGMHWDL
ncbi:glycogen-binding domain-containing protein [Treponema brennaborense]|uniref:AMP-activated protein kinase glycogen-binding domain-containing protein n=1 Tax=Treponema brennaborense (strain DSM 12168 / CIP 105900 / DD5/3) TaxID=906968 RepID=F4LQA3_TREBD|nr:glycogen-binding domain-containing protein [Treponema brennaborense]AEE16124.1 hypothetical protein Trebr_0682 [Treponema brennaborense DSM 12168]